MRVLVVGATGNVGTALVRALGAHPEITNVHGVARRLPGPSWQAEDDRLRWSAVDIAVDALDELVREADVVVHLAWMIQPQRDETVLRRTNLDGTRRLVEACVAARVPKLVYASSVGTYAPGPKQPRVDESWPATGIPSSTYSRHKAAVEALLDVVESANPELTIVRMRTSLVFQSRAASEVHRLFLGALAPWHLPRLLRLVPAARGLVAQVTHADDIGDAYVRAATRDVRGAFNIAADPPLDPSLVAEVVGGRTVPVPVPVLRAGAWLSYRLHLQPSEPGWLDMALQTPLLDTTRARVELGWSAQRSSTDALAELLAGIGAGAGDDTSPLHPRRRCRLRG